MSIFSRCYDAGLQEQFETAFQRGDSKTASEILQRFPPSQDPRAFPEAEQARVIIENFNRLIVLNEGYRALVSKMINPLDTRAQEELQRYQNLGEITKLEEELKAYRSHGHHESLTATLKEYHELGKTPDDIAKEIRDLKREVESSRTLSSQIVQSLQ